jgi:hypothetical protein
MSVDMEPSAMHDCGVSTPAAGQDPAVSRAIDIIIGAPGD